MATSRTLLTLTRRLTLVSNFESMLMPNRLALHTDLPIMRISMASYSSLNNCRVCEVFKSSQMATNLGVCANNLLSKRFKKTRSKGPKKDDEESDDDDNDDLSEENPLLVDDILGGNSDGSETVDINVSSLRLDAFAKVAFGVTRAKVEETFYKGDLFINGERPSKKSCDLSEGDEIDMIKQINPENHTMVDIRRVQLFKLPDKTTEHGRFKVKIVKWNNLTVKPHETK